MKKQITSAHVEIEDLEKMGWEFGDLYEAIQQAQRLSESEAKKQAHEKMHVVIEVREDGSTYYHITDSSNRVSDSDETGDDEQTKKNLLDLAAAGKLWDVECA